jgi:hypothetical protein
MVDQVEIVILIISMLLVVEEEMKVSTTSPSIRMVDLVEVVETCGQQPEQETYLVVQHGLVEMLFKVITLVEHTTVIMEEVEVLEVLVLVKMVDIVVLMKELVEEVLVEQHLVEHPIPQVMVE